MAPEDIDGTLVVLGSHDNTLDLLATLLRRRDHRLRLSSGHVGSLGGLMALRQGRAHLGGSHMLDPETNTYNVPFIKRYLAGRAPEAHQPGLAGAGPDGGPGQSPRGSGPSGI